jgi:ABC-type transporter Mla maintaining outer membrane lipid asymmetry ATPase subunit MlaF
MLHRGQVRYRGPVDEIEDCEDNVVQQFWHGYTEDGLSNQDGSTASAARDGHLSSDDSTTHP